MSPGSRPSSLTDLPGGDLIAAGLEDLHRGVESVPALLVQIGAPRLRQLGFEVPVRDAGGPLPEHRLYELLAEEHGNAAHSRYNALIRRLVSLTRAIACVRCRPEEHSTSLRGVLADAVTRCPAGHEDWVGIREQAWRDAARKEMDGEE